MDQIQKEVLMLQKIKNVLSQNPKLKKICEQIDLQYIDSNLSLFLRELFKILCENSLFFNELSLTIELINELLNKQVFKNNPINFQLIDYYFNHRYDDVLSQFYENAFLKGAEEAQNKLYIIFLKKIIIEYKINKQSAELCDQILQKIEDVIQNEKSEQISQFEVIFYESLDQNQAEILQIIISEEQNKEPKLNISFQDQFFQTLPQKIQELFYQSDAINMIQLKSILQKELIKDQNNDIVTHYINRIDGFIYVVSLNNLFKLYYLTSPSTKIAQKKNEIIEIMNKLENDVVKYNKELKSIIDLENVKYFYKVLKLKHYDDYISNTFSFKNQFMILFCKQLKTYQLQKNIILSIKYNIKDIYKQCYCELINLLNKNVQKNKIYEFILNIQRVIVNFLQYRWIYQLVFALIICDNNLCQQQKDIAITILFKIAQNQPKKNLQLTFCQLITKLIKKCKFEISKMNYQQYYQQFQYESLMQLETQLTYVNNKIFSLYIQSSKVCQQEFFEDLCQIEINMIVKSQKSLKNNQSLYNELQQLFNKKHQKYKLEYFGILERQFLNKLQVLFKQEKISHNVYYYQYYQLYINQFIQDYQKGSEGQLSNYIQNLKQQERFCQIISQFFLNSISKFPQESQIYQFINCFVDIFLKNNQFIFFLPNIIGCLYYANLQLPIQYKQIYQLIYVTGGFLNRSEQEIQNMLDLIINNNNNNNIISIQYQYEVAQDIFNHYARSIQNQINNKILKWHQKYPKEFDNAEIEKLNNPIFNALLIIINKIYSNDLNVMIQSEPEMIQKYFNRLYYLIFKKHINFEEIRNNHDEVLAQLYQEYKELQDYKSQLIFELQQSYVYSNFKELYLNLFRKYSLKKYIIKDVIEYKKQYNVNLNQIEITYIKLNTWLQILQQEQQQPYSKESYLHQKVLDYLKLIEKDNNQYNQFINRIKFDQQQNQDLKLQKFADYLFKKYHAKLKTVCPKNLLQEQNNQIPIIKFISIKNKLQQLSLSQNKLKNFEEADYEVLIFINDQFILFMKGLLSKIIQATLIQKIGSEFLFYQQNTEQEQILSTLKQKQLIDLYKNYGPETKLFIDSNLLQQKQQNQSNQQNQGKLHYQLCDQTPIQQSQEFFNFIQQIEQQQEQDLKNKISKKKWKKEHPELHSILKKKIKKEPELWYYVSNFLNHRDSNQNVQNYQNYSKKSNEESIYQPSGDSNDIIEDNDINFNIQKIQDSNKIQFDKLKSINQAKLNSLYSDQHLITQKIVTIQTMQYVLEQYPYFRKSKILYKSYIL